jgi:hypothetical protein
MEDKPRCEKGSSQRRRRRRVPRGRIGAADGRNLADSEGQQGTAKLEVSGRFHSTWPGGRNCWSELSHGSGRTAATAWRCILPVSTREGLVSGWSDSTGEHLARNAQDDDRMWAGPAGGRGRYLATAG